MVNFQLDNTGCIRFGGASHICILNVPVGILVHGQTAYRPLSASFDGTVAEVQYPCGGCRIAVLEKEGYVKLTLLSVPDNSDGFIFGPYETDAASYGEILGAGWYEDGSVICIQSLIPRVVEGVAVPFAENRSGVELSGLSRAAMAREEKVYLQVSAADMSREVQRPDGFVVKPVRDADALLPGAAIALLYADCAEELLDHIGEMELAEGLPHPVYRGSYAKKDLRASAPYLIFGGSHLTPDELVDLASMAGVSCVYFSDIFDHWGHFTIRKDEFPNGIADVRQHTDKADESHMIVGAHCLSNFITTNDAYVTPIPHKNLQIRDTTVLKDAISAEDTEIHIADIANYIRKSALNTFRIGDELIIFGEFDSENCLLTGCVRGAYGTAAISHEAGETVQRLCDHKYRTLFPDIDLQDEIADTLGRVIRDCGIKKISFDGLEGCDETGYPEYARNRFVKRVYDIVGNEFLCDGSNISHYLWHAFSYCNWGEPWYDHARRGGLHTYRYLNTQYMERNLLPPMIGWFSIYLNRGRYEATSPEVMEHILSRNVAFRAGSAISIHTNTALHHGRIREYMELIRRWNRFRLEADIPEEVLKRMQEEKTDWHLEETEDGWVLTELFLREQDLDYGAREIRTEAGQVGEASHASENGKQIRHMSIYPLDAPHPEFYPEPLHIRIRVGEPEHGSLSDLVLYDAIRFAVQADGGDYLEYRGGMELYRYDCNYNLLETITGIGVPVCFGDTIPGRGHGLGWGSLQYTTNDDPMARYILTEIRGRRRHRIARKA